MQAEELGCWFKKGIDDVLFLLHVFFALFKTVTLPLDVDDGAVMQDTVKDGVLGLVIDTEPLPFV